MNEIIVGVKRIGQYGTVEDEKDIVGALQTHFVIIDGVEVPGMVKWTKCETSAEFMEVTISFIASEYRTVSHLEKEKFLKGDAG
jgi:hypothetical protein